MPERGSHSEDERKDGGKFVKTETKRMIIAIAASAWMLTATTGWTMANHRVADLEIQRDIYKSRAEDWEQMADDWKDTAYFAADVTEELANELKARKTLGEKLIVEDAGTFVCTAYCTEKYEHICGTGTGITASGAPVEAGVTVAADQSIFPYGTVLYIEDVGIRIVQDKGEGVQGNHIDVAVDTHENALVWSGYGEHRVWTIRETE